MIKTRLGAMIGGAFWTPGATIIGSSSQNLTQLIKAMFANNEQGFAYDPNDLNTMWQDADGTIPVTAAGQPVGLMLDKSGRNNHAFQTVSASRPILQRNATTGAYYLAFDGVDDFLRTNNIDFTVTDKVSLFAGVRKLIDASTGTIVESGTNYTIPRGGFVLNAPLAGGASYGAGISGVAGIVSTGNILGYAAPNSAILSLKIDLSKEIYSDQLKFRINATDKTYSTGTSAKGGNFANTPIYIGRRAGTSIPFNGHIYSLIGIGRLTTDSETIALEKVIAKNTGVTLNV